MKENDVDNKAKLIVEAINVSLKRQAHKTNKFKKESLRMKKQ